MSIYLKSKKTDKKIIQKFIEMTNRAGNFPTISELCYALDIDRSTFYNHFNDIEDLTWHIYVSVEEKTDFFKKNERLVSKDDFRRLIDICEENSDKILFLFNPNNSPSIRNRIKDTIFDAVKDSVLKSKGKGSDKYTIRYITDGIIGTMYEWLNDKSLPSQEFSNHLYDLVMRTREIR